MKLAMARLVLPALMLVTAAASPPPFNGRVLFKIRGHTTGQFRSARSDFLIEGLSFREVSTEVNGNRAFEVSAEWGPEMPLVLNSMLANETLTEVEFQFWKHDGDRGERIFETLKVENAQLSSFVAAYTESPFDQIYTAIVTAPASHVGVIDSTGTLIGATTTQSTAPRAGLAVAAMPVPVVQVPTVVRSAHSANYQPYGGIAVHMATLNVLPAHSFHDEYPPSGGHAVAQTTISTAEITSLSLSAARGATGQLAVQPVLITKPQGASTPDFQQARQNGTSLAQVRLNFLAPDHAGSGVSVSVLHVDAAGARIVSDQVGSDAHGQPVETVGLTAQTLTVTYPPAATAAQGAWH